jgi:hypothetical protein
MMSPRRILASVGRQLLFNRSLAMLVVIVILGAALTIAYPGIFFNTINFSSILLNMAMDTMIVGG